MQKIIRIEKELEGIILKDDTIDEFLELIDAFQLEKASK